MRIPLIFTYRQPWPLIAAITRHMRDDGNDNNYYGDIVLSSSSSASASPGHSGTPAGSTSSSATATGSSSSSSTPIAAATRMLVRAVASNTSSSNGANPSPTWTDSTGDDGWAGDGYWSDSYTPSMRWTAIGVLLGVLICAWTPWLYVTIRVSLVMRDGVPTPRRVVAGLTSCRFALHRRITEPSRS